MPILGDPGTVQNKDRNETGFISKPIHETVEPLDVSKDALDLVFFPYTGSGAVHEGNCTAVITVEDIVDQL